MTAGLIVTVIGASSAASGATPTTLPPRLGSSKGPHFVVDHLKGSDRNSGTARSPWRTIARAWRSVPAGSVIEVRPGTYTEQTFLTGRSASASNPITLRAAVPGTVLLENAKSSTAAVYIEGVRGLRVQGFRISNPSSDGIKVTNSSDVELVRNEVYGNGNQAIIVIGDGSGGQTYSSNVQIWSNRIHGNGVLGSGAFNHGIYYGASSDPNDGGTRRGTIGGVIANNIVYDQPTGYLLQLGPQADGVIVTNNTLTGARSQDPNTGSAIALWGTGGPLTTRNVVIVNNVMAFNVKSALHETDDVAGHATVHHNLSYANLGDDGTSSLLDGANVTGVDPLFVDRGGGDFRPRAGSPTIGRADRVYAPPTDAAGASRGSSPEIGAFELVPRKTVAARR